MTVYEILSRMLSTEMDPIKRIALAIALDDMAVETAQREVR